MEDFKGTKYLKLGAKGADVFWGHGWGQSHESFLPIAEPLKMAAKSVLVDFPGFGGSPVPDEHWGTAEYADHVAALIRNQSDKPVIWVGHSFGCRVGVQLAARHPDLIKGLFLIAAAGLPRKRPLWQKIYFKTRIAVYKFLKKLIPFGLPEDWLIKTFASADYKSAGPLRTIFVRVVNEDLTETAKTITCPVHLVYGENDNETPPELGQRYSRLIPSSELSLLKGQDHYSVLSGGHHQVTKLLKGFIEDLS